MLVVLVFDCILIIFIGWLKIFFLFLVDYWLISLVIVEFGVIG